MYHYYIASFPYNVNDNNKYNIFNKLYSNKVLGAEIYINNIELIKKKII